MVDAGKWTAISALDYGMPVTLIGESVFARCLSSLKVGRVAFRVDTKFREISHQKFVSYFAKFSVYFAKFRDRLSRKFAK